ncbi:MAG: hypothetical protein ACC707_01575 [Thiohalomonadales bacterium]
MSFTEFFIFITSKWVSVSIVGILIVAFLYMARESAHHALRSFTRVLHTGFRLSSKALGPIEKRLALRNREVLLSDGREASERIIEREFERITGTVKKELADTPALQRRILEEITHLEDDYKQSTEVPPSPPGWVNAVDAVAKIPAKGDPLVVDILEDIHASLVKAHAATTEEYRDSRKERHQMLKNMMPSWRKVSQVLGVVDKNVCSLLERAKVIDRYMEDYEQVLNGTDRAVRNLSSSSLNQFFISAFVLAIAVGGALINFNLIARPMSEMVGGNAYVGDWRVADLAALVIILVEITMGLFLMETLRITRLFPAVGALKDSMRIRMFWITLTILGTLAMVEAGLAYMRELLMQDELATSALLRGEAIAASEAGFTWITTVAQMGMGFILPFALTFVAIPLETFVQSLRTVLGVVAVGVVRIAAFSLRLIGSGFYYMGSMSIHVYDLLIFAPLWLERKLSSKTSSLRAQLKKDRRRVDPPELVKEAS